MFSRVLSIIRKEVRELLRDPVYMGLAFVVPLSLKLLFGYGLIMDVKNIPITFYDQDRSSLSREYRNAFTNSEYFKLFSLAKDRQEVDYLIRSGTVRVVVDIPPDFSQRLRAGIPVPVQVLVDGSFPMRAEVVKGYVAAIDALFNQRLVSDYLASRGQAAATVFPISVEGRAWYNPSLESKNFIIPGLLVITLMFYPALLAALVVVREKEAGTIFNLYCSPVRPWENDTGISLFWIYSAHYQPGSHRTDSEPLYPGNLFHGDGAGDLFEGHGTLLLCMGHCHAGHLCCRGLRCSDKIY